MCILVTANTVWRTTGWMVCLRHSEFFVNFIVLCCLIAFQCYYFRQRFFNLILLMLSNPWCFKNLRFQFLLEQTASGGLNFVWLFFIHVTLIHNSSHLFQSDYTRADVFCISFIVCTCLTSRDLHFALLTCSSLLTKLMLNVYSWEFSFIYCNTYRFFHLTNLHSATWHACK